MIDLKRLSEIAASYEIMLNANQLHLFDVYADFLLDYNKKVNLTAITAPEEMEIKHFLDCLLLAKQPEAAGRIADVGSGAGFPGFVLKIWRPENDVTLLEPTKKRVAFLTELAGRLGVDVAVEGLRAEEAARQRWREDFDLVTARAVATLPVLCEYCLPLVRSGGYFIAMKGSDLSEADAAQQAIDKLGGKYRENRRYTLPDGSLRQLIVVQKVAQTAKIYPRNGGVIVKRPL